MGDWEPTAEIRVTKAKPPNGWKCRLEQKWRYMYTNSLGYAAYRYEWRWVATVQGDWTHIEDRTPA